MSSTEREGLTDAGLTDELEEEAPMDALEEEVPKEETDAEGVVAAVTASLAPEASRLRARARLSDASSSSPKN